MNYRIAFHRNWVFSIYLKLIRGNFLKMDTAEKTAFVEYMQFVLSEIDDDMLLDMLNSPDWRVRLTAGWIVGFGRFANFTDIIGENLMRFPRDASMYCFALARIDGDAAAHDLRTYLAKYLRAEVAQDFDAEKYSVDYALAALEHISPDAFSAFFPARWNAFVQASVDFYTEDMRETARARWNFDRTRDEFSRWIHFAETHFD